MQSSRLRLKGYFAALSAFLLHFVAINAIYLIRSFFEE
jgi:hypothetical protein